MTPASRNGETEFVRMDDGSVACLKEAVDAEVGCGSAMNLIAEDGMFDWLRHGLFCRLMFASLDHNAPTANAQCVLMGGDVARCPRFGSTGTGESKGEHGKLAQLAALQAEIASALKRSATFNYSSVYGSRFDPSNR